MIKLHKPLNRIVRSNKHGSDISRYQSVFYFEEGVIFTADQKTSIIYAPMIKWKQGEQKAIKFLAIQTKQRMLPIFEMVPIPYDFDKKCDKKTIDGYLSKFGKKLAEIWKIDQPVMLDLSLLKQTTMLDGASPVLEWLLKDAAAHKVRVIPVTGFGHDPAFQTVVKSAVTSYKEGVAIRIKKKYFGSINTTLPVLLTTLAVTPSETDLIIDCELITEDDVNPLDLSIETLLKRIPNIKQYRRVILSATAFPKSLANIKESSCDFIPRSEYDLWKKVNKNTNNPIKVIFSDYNIDDPSLPDNLNPRILFKMIVATIRYTCDNTWFIVRGIKISEPIRFAQFSDLAKQIINYKPTIYCGRHFSAGDNLIYECANGACSTGNLVTWVFAGANHHFTFVVDQLANTLASSGTP